MPEKHQGYSTNTIVANRYGLDNVVNAEIESLKVETKLQEKYKRNIFIQKFDESNRQVQVDFLHNDGKLKSHIYYNWYNIYCSDCTIFTSEIEQNNKKSANIRDRDICNLYDRVFVGSILFDIGCS